MYIYIKILFNRSHHDSLNQSPPHLSATVEVSKKKFTCSLKERFGKLLEKGGML